MSLIIAYIGKKGCVMASDKRRIAYFGNKDNLSKLEEILYSGKIQSDAELYAEAAQLDISIKITDDANKISAVGDTIMGEVSSKGSFETKRKRIYGTTNGYQIIKLSGSKLTSKEVGKSAIILFGNKYSKTQASKLINQKWKSSQSLKFMGDVFVEILEQISKNTPTLGDKFDVLIQQPDFTPQQAQQHIDITIDREVKVLSKFRQKLQEDLIEKNKEIELASKIINEGEIGEVVSVDDNLLEIKLNNKTQAFDFKWKQLAAPGGKVVMFTESKDVKTGDKVVIEDGTLCIKRDKSPLNCNIILCSL